MKNKLVSIFFTVLLAFTIVGCKSVSSEEIQPIPIDETVPALSDENASKVETSSESASASKAETATDDESASKAETATDDESASKAETAADGASASIAETAADDESASKAETAADGENASTDENTTAQTEVAELKEPETKAPESVELTFADLAKRQFEFSSGAGGWSEEFTIEKDGYFTGMYHDSNMGSTGEGYDNGTIYHSSYSGHFTDLTKIDDYTYQMKLADISYKESIDTEEIIDNTRYIYTESYCLGGTDTFTIYLPGTPLDELKEEIYIWVAMMNQNEPELTMLVIADEANGYGIYSYDRLNPIEDARMTFNNYKYSYDYYGEMLSEAATTAEMVEYSGNMYELSDECLNYIWNLIRYNVEDDKYQEILTKQREWIAQKEAKAKEASAEYEGGSFAAVSYNDTLATLTIKRCEELIEYLEDNTVTQQSTAE